MGRGRRLVLLDIEICKWILTEAAVLSSIGWNLFCRTTRFRFWTVTVLIGLGAFFFAFGMIGFAAGILRAFIARQRAKHDIDAFAD